MAEWLRDPATPAAFGMHSTAEMLLVAGFVFMAFVWIIALAWAVRH